MTKSWKEGKILDTWSIVHTLAGLIAGLIPLVFQNLNAYQVAFIFLLLAIGWEIFESYKEINEYWSNRLSDVIVAMLGFYFSYQTGQHISNDLLMTIFISYTLLYLILTLYGFSIYKSKELK
jgi:uncharacterized membrane protein YfcA